MQCIKRGEKNYPFMLNEIHYPPEILYFKGNIELLKKVCVCIVGTRNPSDYADLVLKQIITKKIGQSDICIVSGLARGVDTLVHNICLEMNIPTIAVIAGGIENIYPYSNSPLYNRVGREGLILAEYPGKMNMKKGMFPQRNRILAGLSKAVIVIEADVKSGSLITANFALNEGRDVYAVPGDISRNTSRGCNILIKQGATLITDEEDFEEVCGIEHDQLKMNI